jgi:hypothetical protein
MPGLQNLLAYDKSWLKHDVKAGYPLRLSRYLLRLLTLSWRGWGQL